MKKILILLTFISIFLTAQSGQAQDFTNVATATTVDIIKHNRCVKVNNTTGRTAFLPHKTLVEWMAFITGTTPATLTRAQCSCVCPDASTVALGAACTGGGICAGYFKGNKYMVMPGNCDGGTTNPTCTGGADTNLIRKQWNNGSENWYDIPGVEHVGTGGGIVPRQTPSTVLGDVNTTAIAAITLVAQGGVHEAANYCENMTYGGYTDWYLPSKSELAYLFCNSNRSAFKAVDAPEESVNCNGDYSHYLGPLTALTGFADKYYWSSTESLSVAVGDRAWSVDFEDGYLTRGLKYDAASGGANTLLYVRCIRRY